MFIHLKKNIQLSGCKYVINRVQTEHGFYFEILFSREPRPRTVTKAVRRCGGRQPLPIAQSGFHLSEQLRERCLPSVSFDKILLINAFSHAVTGQRQALVIDKAGTLCDFLLPPLCRVGTLCVVTERPDLYERFSQRSLRAVGSSVLLISENEAFGFPATLCADRDALCSGIIFGEGGFMPVGDTVIYKSEKKDRALMTAFYCCLDNKKAALCLPEALSDGHRTLSIKKLKQMLDSQSALTL